jgi:DNA helicase-2/ATP-dependent DNA helicase PcrA
VDEYQDTNLLQARVLERLCPEGKGLTVVGDDAQSIYSFRAATVHNILYFPRTFPAAEVVKAFLRAGLAQIPLTAANAVIALSPQRHEKELFTLRKGGQKPILARLTDEDQQTRFIIERVLQHLEAGIALRKQAVLFRTLHHSDALEVELARRSIPFVKYGGLKFLEAAHVKDLLSYLRLAENARDTTSAFRVLQLMDGIGPAIARRALEHLTAANARLQAWEEFAAPPAASAQWKQFVALMLRIAGNVMPLAEQIADCRRFYTPILEKRYEQAAMRARDLEQLEQLSSNFRGRSEMLAELTLDPPSSTQDLAGPPLLEEDYLILSTIHSAKGCEWDAVYVLHAADGNIPSDMSTGSQEQIEEERRLFYVALTRAKDFLYVCQPAMYYQKKLSSRYSLSQLTRFLPDSTLEHFEQLSLRAAEGPDAPHISQETIANIRTKIAGMWE